MSLGFSRIGSCILLLAFVGSGLVECRVQAQGKQRPRRFIELSETNSAEILTNLNQLTTKKEGMRQLEDQLRTLKDFSKGNSIESSFSAPYAAPPSRALPNKTIRELLERRKNWDLTDELGTSSTSDSDVMALFGDDKTAATDKSDSKKSSLQQFYEGLKSDSSSTSDRSKDRSFSDRSRSSYFSDDSSSADDSTLPPGVREKAQKLKSLVNEDSSSIFNPTRTRSSFENFFGLNNNNNSDTAMDAGRGPKTSVESFVDQFKKVLDAQSPALGLDPALSRMMPSSSTPKPVSYPTMDQFPTSSRHELTESTPGNINSVLNRGTLPDVNATVLNQWNPMYSPPKLEPPKPAPPTPLNMEFPRRRF